MSNNLSPNFLQQTVDVPVPLKLRDDDKPTLVADLDAQGHDLVNVGDVKADTWNGTNFIKTFMDGVRDLKDYCVSTFAVKGHWHELKEVSGLPAFVDAVASTKVSELRYAKPEHNHALQDLQGELPLEKLEGGEELKSLLGQQFALADHTHPKDLIGLDRGGLGLDLRGKSGVLMIVDGKVVTGDLRAQVVTKDDLNALREELLAAIQVQK